MQIKRATNCLGLCLSLFTICLMWPRSVNAQSLDFMQKYWQGIKTGEQALQGHLPEFRFVTRIEDFDDRLNATLTFPVTSSPEGAIATLHDIQTGEPLQNCLTPCNLNIDAVRTYGLSYFKFGHQPQVMTLHSADRVFAPYDTYLGMNFLEAYKEGVKCYRTFMAETSKPDATAAPCYRVPPLMPETAETSGHCLMRFDVTRKGRAENITAISCSDSVFKAASGRTVKWWAFTPKIDRGEAVTETGVETKIVFRLMDKSGELIPES